MIYFRGINFPWKYENSQLKLNIMEKFNIFGISGNLTEKDWEKHFVCSRDESKSHYFKSLKTFHHDDDISFDYKFVVRFDEMYWINSKDFAFDFSLVFLPDSLSENNLESIMRTCGIEKEDVNVYDIYDQGFLSISFGSGTCAKGKLFDTMVQISNVYEIFNTFFGYYVDKPINRIGTTGWDIIKHAVKGTDIFKKMYHS